jgi:hypothetical protein
LGHVVQIKPDLSHDAGVELAEAESPLRFQAPDGTFYLTDSELLDARLHGLRCEEIRRIRESDLPVRFSLPHDGAVTDWPPEDARLAVLARLLAEDRANGSVHIRFLGRNRNVPADGFALDRAGGQRRYVWQIVPAEVHAARPALHDRFRRLRALCGDPRSRVVLSLGSGGLKLFAHATAIRLFETLGMGHFAEIWGSSAGAMAGLFQRRASRRTRSSRWATTCTRPRRPGAAPTKLQFLRHLARRAAAEQRPVGSGRRLRRRLSRMLERYGRRRAARAVPRSRSTCSKPPGASPGGTRAPGRAAGADRRARRRARVVVGAALFVLRVVRRGKRDTHYIDGSTTEDVPLHSIVRGP